MMSGLAAFTDSPGALCQMRLGRGGRRASALPLTALLLGGAGSYHTQEMQPPRPLFPRARAIPQSLGSRGPRPGRGRRSERPLGRDLRRAASHLQHAPQSVPALQLRATWVTEEHPSSMVVDGAVTDAVARQTIIRDSTKA